MIDDKSAEQARYDRRAVLVQDEITSGRRSAGVESVTPFLRSPYAFYERCIKERVRHGQSILEIGSGTGEFTGAALGAGAVVTATDISEKSLEALAVRFGGVSDQLRTRRADMEGLPFVGESFDMVISAGSLSYGDNETVLGEIHRVIKTGGCYICVD